MLIYVIKNLREQKNISLRELSDRCGLSFAYLSNVENNKRDNCSTKSLEKIAIALDVNIKDLFYTELDIDILKKKLNEAIEEYGIDSKEALEISQLIDLFVNIIQKDINNL